MLYSFPWDKDENKSDIISDLLNEPSKYLHKFYMGDYNRSFTTLNLVNPAQYDIKYEVSNFPDGQQTIDLKNIKVSEKTVSEVIIKSRLNNFKDLEIIICAVKALRNVGYSFIRLYVPYFLGSRSDRMFNKEGGVNYLKQVICPIINSLDLKSVTVIDPHSDVLEATLNNFVKLNNFDLIKMGLIDIDNGEGAQDRVMFISPDAGAYKKIFEVGSHFGVNDIVTCSKHRDVITGHIDSTEVPITKEQTEKNMVIIDDICDGGRSFIEIAKVIREKQKEYGTNGKLYLIVTHGIFSKGFVELNEYFDGIFSTNSYSDLKDEKLLQHNVF